jgi:hypothetical protein
MGNRILVGAKQPNSGRTPMTTTPVPTRRALIFVL